MTSSPPVTKGRRICRMCDRRVRPGERALRCADVTETTNVIGRVRYWLCWGCARDMEYGIEQIRAGRLGRAS